MTLLAAIVALFFVVLVVCGICVNVYMYCNGAFNEKMKRGRKQRLGAVHLSQVDSIPTAESAACLYPKRTRMSTHTRVFLLYSLGLLLSLIVLAALVLGATQF